MKGELRIGLLEGRHDQVLDQAESLTSLVPTTVRVDELSARAEVALMRNRHMSAAAPSVSRRRGETLSRPREVVWANMGQQSICPSNT